MQPTWKCIGHVGDMDPIAYGGGFVYEDETGVYGPELTLFEPDSDDRWDRLQGKTPVQVYRIMLERPRHKTFNDAPWDRDKLNIASERGKAWRWHNEWYVDQLDRVCESCGVSKIEMLRDLLSNDSKQRAWAYATLANYFGAYEFDQYPNTMTEDEAYEQYAAEMAIARAR